MASVNKVIVLGNIGKDPELRYNPSGVAFCTLSIATTRTWKSKDGEKKEETEWHRVVFNDKLAEIVGEYCKKGKPLYVEGRLRTRKWQDKQGKDQYTTEIIADQMQMLGGRDSGEEQQPARPAPARRSAPGSAASYGSAGQADAKPSTGFDDMEDDIPFILSLNEYELQPSKQRRVRCGEWG